ncbi:MAG: UDP-glucose 4-epimerase GalE [Proteobacteria bacterium]|nr:UDP-glucose 4-epimerase GalE [Pseudomonadota bacterium]
MPRKTQNILVLGGAGYIGSHTCKALSQQGYTPVVYDNFSSGNKSLVKWGPCVEADIHDTDKLKQTLTKYAPLAVMHFAASIAAGESVYYPEKYYANNVAGSNSVLTAIKESNVRHFIFSSSAAVYGALKQQPIKESAEKNPINPYGRSKLIVEQMLGDFETACGLKHVSLRYFNAAGADPAGEIGNVQKNPTNLVPVLVHVQAGILKKLEVFGTNYNTPDGTAIRDYIHVSDLADGHIAALKYLLAGGNSDAINLGTGRGASVREVIRSMEHASGKKVRFKDVARRAGDPPKLVADVKKARRVLGWTAKRVDIDTITRTAWNWHLEYGKNY